MARQLHIVTPDEKAMSKKRLTITGAADNGTRRDLLVAMRARIATAVEDPNTPPRDLAALSRRLIEIAKDIEAIDAAADEEAHGGGSVADEAWEAI